MIIRLPTALTRFRHAKSPYIIVIGSAGQRVYTAVFAGDSTYGASSGTVTVTVKYGASLSPTSAVTSSVIAGEKYPLSGYLKDQDGKPLAGQKIQFYWRTSTSAPWRRDLLCTPTTAAITTTTVWPPLQPLIVSGAACLQ